MLIPHRALAYDSAEKNGYKLNLSYYEQLGDGAVHTTVGDLAKWDENFYSGRIGGEGFLKEMLQPGKLNDGKTLDYAKGLFLGSYRGLPTVRHGGAWGGDRAELLRFPEQHFSVACLCNLSNADPEKRAEQVAGVYLQKVMKPEQSASPGLGPKQTAVNLTPAQISSVMGAYLNPAEGNVARVVRANHTLQMEIDGSIFALQALTPNQFVPVDSRQTCG